MELTAAVSPTRLFKFWADEDGNELVTQLVTVQPDGRPYVRTETQGGAELSVRGRPGLGPAGPGPVGPAAGGRCGGRGGGGGRGRGGGGGG